MVSNRSGELGEATVARCDHPAYQRGHDLRRVKGKATGIAERAGMSFVDCCPRGVGDILDKQKLPPSTEGPNFIDPWMDEAANVDDDHCPCPARHPSPKIVDI